MKYTKYSIPLGAIAGLAISVTTSQAAITYVDAQAGSGGNTRDSSKPQNDETWIAAGTGADNDQWTERTGFGTNSNIFQALPSGDPSSIPQLTTTISGLTDGQTYAVYAFFQDNTGDTSSPYQNWVLSAGLTISLDTTYWSDGQPLAAHNSATPVLGTTGSGTISTTGVSEASTLTYAAGTAPTDVLSGEGTTGERRLYAVYLGETTLSGATEIDVYVDMLIEGKSSETRTWYDGVGYEAVPEPSSTALLGLGGLSLILRRRR